jgi:predicted dehydrogenase
MAARPKVAVIGTGSLGKEHARLYAQFAAAGLAEFVGLYDHNAATAREIAGKHGTRAFASLEEAAQAADALSIVTPTVTHHAIARDLLARGKHLLVEKPMTHTEAQAADLVQLAQRHQCVLQVGHVERFNPVFDYLHGVARDPRFIEVHRLSPYPARSTDVGVVLDLMIHDLDVVLAIVPAPVVNIEAVGIPVLSAHEDIANARLRFANGCIANITASRISTERLRKIRVFSGGDTPCYVSLDYRAQEGFIFRLAREGEKPSSVLQKLLHAKDAAIVNQFGDRKIVREPVPIVKDEPLKLELQHFLECVVARQTPRVSGATAKLALDVAFEITRQIQTTGARPLPLE